MGYRRQLAPEAPMSIAHCSLEQKRSKEGEWLTGLSLHRRTAPTPCNPTTYEPNLTVLLQGRKRVNMGGTTYVCDDSTFLLTSVDVPVASQIFASEEVPYLVLRLTLEVSMVREIISREDLPEPTVSSRTRSIAVGKTTA